MTLSKAFVGRFMFGQEHHHQMIRSVSTAQTLMAGGVNLPPTPREAVIRPLAALPGPDLRMQMEID